MKVKLTLALACVCGLLFAGDANADDEVQVAPEAPQVIGGDGWTFAFAPYFWAAGLSGDVANFGLPAVDVDASFSDILDVLDFGAMAIAEARNGPYSFYGDLIYTKLSGDIGTPRGVLASRVDVDSETFAGLFAFGYSVLADGSGHLDVVGGVRVWSIDTGLSFIGGILDGAAASDGATWVDAMLGVRGDYALTDTIYLTGWALVGAGGADIDWDVAAGIGYRFNDSISSVIGYRALGVDYEDNDGIVFDVVQQGPILGLVIRF